MYVSIRKLRQRWQGLQFGQLLDQQGPYTLVFVEGYNHFLIERRVAEVEASRRNPPHDLSDIPTITLDTYPEQSIKTFVIANKRDISHVMKSVSQLRQLTNYARHIKQLVTDNKPILSIDFEMFERKQEIILELGIAYGNNNACLDVKHLIIKEHLKYKNGRHVPDYRNNFLFGTSDIVSLQEMKNILQDYIVKSSIIVAHGVKTELDFCRSMSLFMNNIQPIDTGILHQAVHRTGNRVPGLAKCLEHYQIDNQYHHNGGNDAVRTLMLVQKLLREPLL